MHKLYPDWPLTLRAVPPRSRLYHLPPAGVGTEHVETLTGYVTRLAAAHAVPVSTLVGYEIGPGVVGPKHGSQVATGTRRRFVPLTNRHSYMVNASGYPAQNWGARLCHLTGEDNLRFLTTLCWNGAVSGDEVVRWHRAWCPQCYQAWRDSGATVREPLLWAVRPVSMCALHRRQLTTRCWSCGRTPHVLTARSRSGHCGHCQAWLGSNESGLHGEGETDPQQTYDLWATREIGGLLRVAPFVSHAMSAETLRANLRTCSEHLSRKGPKGRSFAGIVGASGPQVVGWLTKGYLVKLAPLMRISYRLGIPVLDLLCCPPEIFGPDWSLVEQNLRTAGETGSTSSRPVMAIPDSCDPMPLTVVLEKSGYNSLRNLRNRDPEVHRQLVVKHRATRRMAWKKRMREARASTLAVIEEALIASLSLDYPQLLTRTALEFEFESSTRLRLRFPELCAAIVAKRASWKQRQGAEKEAIAQDSARQEMPPTVESLATNLGCQSRTPIRKRFPAIVSALAARVSDRIKKRREMDQRALEKALKEDPPPSLPELAKQVGRGTCTLRRLFPEPSCAVQVRYHDWKRQAARLAKAALESEVARIVLDLHARGIYPSYDRVGSLLPAGMQGACIVEIVRHSRERLGIPKHHAAIS